ncbi:MAG TPA: hypothetical protein VI911_08715 [Patescibacteria group bacterium]|nr:MAG: hypothetical protein UR43_C0005G0089 [candidate division TM6 bacterium GW2011_GWF2_33_332]HLD91078.1 hypothetical protein [Patescibacteria group bacterium]
MKKIFIVYRSDYDYNENIIAFNSKEKAEEMILRNKEANYQTYLKDFNDFLNNKESLFYKITRDEKIRRKEPCSMKEVLQSCSYASDMYFEEIEYDEEN